MYVLCRYGWMDGRIWQRVWGWGLCCSVMMMMMGLWGMYGFDDILYTLVCRLA